MSASEDVSANVETEEVVNLASAAGEAPVVDVGASPSDEVTFDETSAEGTDLENDEDLDSEDSLTFSNGVIEKIVAIAMRDVPGVVGMKGGWINRVQDVFGQRDPRKGVTVEVTPEASVRVNISVLIEYGAYAPQVFDDVKAAVIKQVTGMTGLGVAGVNLRIEDVLTPEEVAERSRARATEPETLPEAAEIEMLEDGAAEGLELAADGE